MCLKSKLALSLIFTVMAAIMTMPSIGSAEFQNDVSAGLYGGYSVLGSPDTSTGVKKHQGIVRESINNPDYLFGVEGTYRIHSFTIASMALPLSISLGVQYSRKGYDAEGENLYIDADDQIVKAGPAGAFTAEYLSVPLQIRMGIDIETGPFILRPFLTAGPEIAIPLSAVYDHDQSGRSLDYKEHMNTVDLNLPMGLGVDFDFSWGIITLRALYSYAVLPVKKITVQTSSLLDYPWDFTVLEHRHSTLNVTLGYTFKFYMLAGETDEDESINLKKNKGGI